MYLEKYHALGNDFLVVERSDFCDGKNFGELAKRLCSRKKCLGADGLIVVDKKTCQVDFFNADGSFAECCGNGLRCIVAYLKNFSDSDEFELKTADGVKKATVLTAQPFVCKVCLGKVEFFARGKRVDSPTATKLTVGGRSIDLFETRLGVPHAVIFGNEWATKYAKDLCEHKLFNSGTNVDFVTPCNSGFAVHTFERGVGWTDACGTGAGAVGA